ncbi:MAG: hypothetical protein IJ341_08055 [Bacteroidales bacterium]|nr:hypothetical protein [Bacteroidales bacterium]
MEIFNFKKEESLDSIINDLKEWTAKHPERAIAFTAKAEHNEEEIVKFFGATKRPFSWGKEECNQEMSLPEENSSSIPPIELLKQIINSSSNDALFLYKENGEITLLKKGNIDDLLLDLLSSLKQFHLLQDKITKPQESLSKDGESKG